VSYRSEIDTIFLSAGEQISGSEEKVIGYQSRYKRHRVYDGVVPDELDTITEQDRQLGNRLAARRGREAFAPIVGSTINLIDKTWDLFSLSEQDYEKARKITWNTLAPLLTVKGLAIPSLSKALHRKRPNWIPVCDAVLLSGFGINEDKKI